MLLQASYTQLLRVVRITALLLLIGFLHVSAAGFGQNVTFSFRDVPVSTVLQEIIKQTRISIVYDKSEVNKNGLISIDAKNQPIEEVLNRCFKDQPFTYQLVNNTIVVKLKSNSVIQSGESASQPPIDIHGRVTDSLGNPIVGASVFVKGSKIGTTTGADGYFTIKDVPNKASLIISSVGYETRQVKLAGKTDITVTLRQGFTAMEEVIVNKGYYSVRQKDNTGDVSIVKGEDIQKQPVTDPILALEGRVPGLYIQQVSGIPGAYSKVMIRGQNSIANGNDPLYVVDGVPFSSLSLSSTIAALSAVGYASQVSNTLGGLGSAGGGLSPFNELNPADIETVEVLKDADATAIYGSRGANGVILITTKKGKAGTTHFNLNVYTGAGKVPNELKLLNTQQYLAMRHEAYNNDSLPFPSIANDPYDYHYDVNGIWDTTRYTDWQQALIGGSAGLTNIQGNLTGGNDYTQFIVGAGYTKQGTVFPGNFSDQKGSFHLNLTHSSLDRRFGIQLSTNYTYGKNLLPVSDYTASIIQAPDAPALYDEKGNINWQLYNGTSTYFSNVAGVTLKSSTAISNNLLSSLSLHYEFIAGLQLSASFNYNHNELNQNSLTPANSYPPPLNNLPQVRDNLFSSTEFSTWLIEPKLSFHRNFGGGKLDIMTGMSFQQNLTQSLTQDANTFVSDALIANPQAASVSQIVGNSQTEYRYSAIYGRVGYNWNDKYLINLTARRDGSSRFGPGSQFGNFGALGVAWIFSQEKFIKDHLSFLSFGKIRGSYGTTGNDQIADYQWLSTYSSSSLAYQGISNLFPTRLTNPHFAWEVVKKLEGAIELGFLQDRIFISASYYNNRTGNQLVGYPLPNIAGFTTVQYNLPAVVQNTGLEIAFQSVNIKTKNFAWTSTFNISIPRNKLVSYPGLAGSGYRYTYVVGEPLQIRRNFHNTGVDPQTGLPTYASKDGTGMPSYPADLVVTKPVTQKYYGGFDNQFTYKGFSVDIFFQFVNQLANNYQFTFPPAGFDNTNQPTAVLSRWQKSGDKASVQRFGTEFGMLGNSYSNYFGLSDEDITNASFLRLKTLVISYQLSSRLTGKMHLQNFKVYIQCQNLFTITNYVGLDPETAGSISLPPLKMITAGFQISL